MRDASRPLPPAFIAALIALGVLLTATVIPGVFIVDDDNYLVNVVAMRQGTVALANTRNLTPSRELAFFDPDPASRGVDSTPVASTAPPLYGVLAAPFSLLGWRGLVALNTLAFLIAISLVFRYAARYSTEASTAWLAAGAFALAGFQIEYAQGLWPHSLSIALCTAGILAIGRTIEAGRVSFAAAAGVLLALATGLRYQNAVMLAVAGMAILLWSPRRWRATVTYGVAAAVPLLASATINHARLGSWNPITKGPGYINLPAIADAGDSVLEPVTMFWTRLVDFSVRPPLVGPGFGWVSYDAVTGAHMIFGQTPQKALLQSAPWAVLGCVLFALAWMPRIEMPDGRRRQLRWLSLVTMAMLLTFAFAGRYRHEGASYNQRYLLELVPLLAVAFAWALDGFRVRAQVAGAGVAWGSLGAILVLSSVPAGTLRLLTLFRLPLLAAASVAVAWALARTRPQYRTVTVSLAGACLGWGLVVHLATDVTASRAIKRMNLEQTEMLKRVVPDHSALVTYWGSRDAAGPLLLDRDVVVLDANADAGADAPALVRELMSQNRRVLVLRNGMPEQVLTRVLDGWDLKIDSDRGATVELRPKQP